jgi:hypothetical protein
MNPTVLVIALIIVAVVSNWLFRRRFPTMSKQQIFCAIVACVGGVLIVGRPGGSVFWHYTGLVIAVIMGTFLISEFLRPRPTGSS